MTKTEMVSSARHFLFCSYTDVNIFYLILTKVTIDYDIVDSTMMIELKTANILMTNTNKMEMEFSSLPALNLGALPIVKKS